MTFVHQQLRAGGWVAPWLRFQNQSRYEWAARFVEGCRVAEVGCGGGHGTARLSAAGATHVDGFDIDSEAVTHAQDIHGSARLAFQVAPAGSIPADDGSYDLVVSLETIEHVEDDLGYVREIGRIVRPGGTLLCTTPNRLVTNPGKTIHDKPFNPHHIREYTAEELRECLSECFSKVELLGQSPYRSTYVKRLGSVGRRLPKVAVKVHQLRKLLGIPWESIEHHRPRIVPRDREPEVLAAICQR